MGLKRKSHQSVPNFALLMKDISGSTGVFPFYKDISSPSYASLKLELKLLSSPILGLRRGYPTTANLDEKRDGYGNKLSSIIFLYNSCWISHNLYIIGDIFYNHRTGTNHTTFTNSDSLDYHRTGTNPCPLPNSDIAAQR